MYQNHSSLLVFFFLVKAIFGDATMMQRMQDEPVSAFAWNIVDDLLGLRVWAFWTQSLTANDQKGFPKMDAAWP